MTKCHFCSTSRWYKFISVLRMTVENRSYSVYIGVNILLLVSVGMALLSILWPRITGPTEIRAPAGQVKTMGLACNSRATRSHQTGWQWRRMRIFRRDRGWWPIGISVSRLSWQDIHWQHGRSVTVLSTRSFFSSPSQESSNAMAFSPPRSWGLRTPTARKTLFVDILETSD